MRSYLVFKSFKVCEQKVWIPLFYAKSQPIGLGFCHVLHVGPTFYWIIIGHDAGVSHCGLVTLLLGIQMENFSPLLSGSHLSSQLLGIPLLSSPPISLNLKAASLVLPMVIPARGNCSFFCTFLRISHFIMLIWHCLVGRFGAFFSLT